MVDINKQKNKTKKLTVENHIQPKTKKQTTTLITEISKADVKNWPR